MSITLLANSGQQTGRISSSAGIGMAPASDPVVVTAVADRDEKLKLITWKILSDGSTIARFGDSGDQAGTVGLVDIAGASNNRFITAVRAANGKLLLIGWQVNTSNGEVSRIGTMEDGGGDVSLITMTNSPLGDGRVLIAVRDNGNLVVKNWEITSVGGLKRVGDTALDGQPAGAISRVAMGHAGGGKIVTAVRDSTGKLKLIAWQVQSNGSIKRLGDSGQQGDAVSVVDIGEGEGYLVTAVRDGNGNLKLISWKLSPDGTAITRVADSGQAAGGIQRLACASVPKSGILFGSDPSRIVTAVATESDNLKLIAWQVSENGAVSRMEDFDDNAVSGTLRMTSAADMYLTAVRDSSGLLKLATWRFDLARPQPLANNIVAYDKSYFETTAQVIAPGAVAAKGRIVVALGQPRNTSGYVTRDLVNAAGTDFTLTAPQNKTIYPFDLTVQKPATDNQLIRLQDGSLMGIKNGYVWTDLPTPPAWFNTVSLNNQTSQQARNAVFVFRSTDGVSWTLVSFIDSAVVENGDYGWPQWNTKISAYGVGGYDRTEIYQDPWTEDIYISGGGDGGPYTENNFNVENHAGVIFVSKDNGVTWNTLHKLTGQGKGAAPYVMTSTPDHPLVMLTVWSAVPTLYWLEKGASSLSGGKSVAVIENGEAVNAVEDKGIDDLRGAPPCIARIGAAGGGRDRVWIAYKAVNTSGRQVYKLCLVTFGGGQDPVTELITTIQAESPDDRAVCLGGFVQDDRIETQSPNPKNFTMFYWVDAPPKTASDPDGLIVRFKMLRGVNGHYQSGYLSVSDGAKRAFDRLGMGDYFKGGYFEWNNKVNFFVQWPEPSKTMGNIVSMTP